MQKIINDFNRSGYVVLKSVFNNSKINKFLKEIDILSEKLVRNYKRPYVNLTRDNKVNTGHNLNIIFPKSFLMKISKNKIISKILKKMLGENVLVRNLEVFLKPPKTGMRAPFHQDNYYWNLDDKRAVNLWIALDKVEKKNGGLIYLKGSHKGGIIEHKMSNIKGSSQEIDNKLIKKLKYKKVSPKLNPGDCILHHCEVIHGSNTNTTDKMRRAIVISFKAKSSKINKKKFKIYQLKLKKHIKRYSSKK